MHNNGVRLPRPPQQRPAAEALGFYLRVGRNDHGALLNLVATGERSIFGFVIDAHKIERHRVLITEARKAGFDIILDPKTQQMAFPAVFTDALSALPWGFGALPERCSL